MQTIKIKTNNAGERDALTQLNNGGFMVYIEKSNYSQGRDVVKWCCCKLHTKQNNTDFQKMAAAGLDESVAVDLFNKKSK